MAKIDKEAISAAYHDVRSNDSETAWAIFAYDDDNRIVLAATGTEYEEFQKHFADDRRAYGFVQIETGDELSRRKKFAFVTWIGENVSPLKKAKVSTDKGELKQIITSFAAEVLTMDKDETNLEHVKAIVVKAGGANYGRAK